MAVCPCCSLHCDDLQIELEGQKVISLAPECPKARAGFAEALLSLAIETQPTALPEALHKIQSARRVLVLIGGGISWAAQAQAAALARQLNAWADTPASLGGCALPWASMEAGWPGCTLGELRARARTVVLLDAPLESGWPRFADRFLQGQENLPARLEVNSRPFTPARAVTGGRPEIETLVELRLCLREEPAEISPELQKIAESIQTSPWGVVIIGPQWAAGGRMLAIELIGLLNDLSGRNNSHWQGLYLPGGSNWPGASQALSAECGYPCAVRFSARQAQFSPSEYTAASLFERQIPDLVLLAGEANWLPGETLDRLAATPKIVVSSRPPPWADSVWLPTSLPGLDGNGVFLRADLLPVDLSRLVASRSQPAEMVLNKICAGLRR